MTLHTTSARERHSASLHLACINDISCAQRRMIYHELCDSDTTSSSTAMQVLLCASPRKRSLPPCLPDRMLAEEPALHAVKGCVADDGGFCRGDSESTSGSGRETQGQLSRDRDSFRQRWSTHSARLLHKRSGDAAAGAGGVRSRTGGSGLLALLLRQSAHLHVSEHCTPA